MNNDLLATIAKGMFHLTNSFDADSEGLPWFDIRLRQGEPAYLEHFLYFDASHVPGRCLDGLLFGEAVTGSPVPGDVIATYRKFIFESYAAEDGLNGYLDPATGKRQVLFHNFREGLLALHALRKWRQDEDAGELAENMIAALLRLSDEHGEWIPEQLARLRQSCDLIYDDVPTTTTGRLVGPLIKYYKLTNHAPALQLAQRFADHALRASFHEDGTLKEKAGTHVHSITSTVSSLCEYYDFIGDREKLASVKQIYDNGIAPWRSSFGWVKELIGPAHLGGEVNSTGDLVQCALIFGKHGYPDAYRDAEQMLRGHLLPSQVEDAAQIDPSWFVQDESRPEDKWKQIALRIQGGFGFPTPNDRAPVHYDNDYIRITTLDITGGSVQALCESWLAALEQTDAKYILHLLFDRPTGPVVVHCADYEQGVFRIECESAGLLKVRMPGNSVGERITFQSDNDPVTVEVRDGYVGLQASSDKPMKGILTIPMTNKDVVETLCGEAYRSKWVGEQVVAIEPKGGISPIFD